MNFDQLISDSIYNHISYVTCINHIILHGLCNGKCMAAICKQIKCLGTSCFSGNRSIVQRFIINQKYTFPRKGS